MVGAAAIKQGQWANRKHTYFFFGLRVVVTCIICWFNVLGVRLDVICKLETL